MAKSKYVSGKKVEINRGIEFSINEHLRILNSDIILPVKKVNGFSVINEIRLLPTVKSREIVYNNLIFLLDNPSISPSIKLKAEPKTISGIKKTIDQLLEKIVYRPLRIEFSDNPNEDSDDSDDNDEKPDQLDITKTMLMDETSDDIISSMSNAATVAVSLIISMKDKVEILEDPETHKKEKIENEIIPSIAERYARN